MKITEYARLDSQWQEIRQYYWFPAPVPDSDLIRQPRAPCPGCGRALSNPALRQHECLGGRTGWPRITGARVRTRLEQDPQLLREYIRTRRHPVLESDEAADPGV